MNLEPAAALPLTRAEMDAWLGWYEAMGAAVWCADEPADWAVLEQQRQAARSQQRAAPVALLPSLAPAHPIAKPTPRSLPPNREPLPGPPAALPTAAIVPAPATTLEALREAIAAFEGCALKTTAKNLCFYRGIAQAPLMVIGEAPGRDEDLAGKPFVGAAGQLLDRMLAAIGLDDSKVHITNAVYWRPPGNRVPSPQEVRACLPFLLRQIELVAPRLLLVLGGVAAQSLLQTDIGITKLRGKWRTVNIAGRDVPVLPSLHPAYLLRTPIAKRQAWADLLEVQRALFASSTP